MDNIHRLLKRQIKIYLHDIKLDNDFQTFIEAVNQAYINHDKERSLLERSIDISSKEYNENMEKIRMLQSQLIQQEKLAGIGQLSAGVAHEINNPLGYVQSNMDTLKKYLEKVSSFLSTLSRVEKTLETDSDANLQELFQIIEKALKENKINYITEDLNDIIDESMSGLTRIEKIVKSLLGFSRVSSLEFEEYNLNKGIKDTLAVANNEIKYTTKIIEDLGDIPYIKAAGGAINQVLLNLIINAVHAIRESSHEGVINIKTFTKDNFVYCVITDNGKGIPEENIDNIFTPFFTTKPVGVGTGLGLSIAYDIIVNKHSGQITVKSELGKGTTFTIYLPIQHHPSNL
ncbi:sensor histidine kinase [Pectinatus frisingensis]|uniref:sensor histidine kinase n=1 Tax=Pectinatus frisingensis TaxID=865 RepID=UPI0018C65A2C|nr:ATP-binding protein [Pectinatus frisingensis]